MMKKAGNIKVMLEGAIISSDEMNVASESRKKAGEYAELFHCTRTDALLSIIDNKEFWLGSLKCVNDREEKERIDVPAFEKSFYVACFSHQNNVAEEHWNEYADMTDGVLFSVRKEWFQQKAYFLTSDNEKCMDINIFPSTQEAFDFQTTRKIIGGTFSIFDFDFYKIIYDDELYANIKQRGSISSNTNSIEINLIIPATAGIVKKKIGFSYRNEENPKLMNWEKENEVRLKVGIWQGALSNEGMPFYSYKLAVPMVDSAFSNFSIRFSPQYPEGKKTELIEKIKIKIPNCNITIL